MTNDELENLLLAVESDRVERKASFSEKDRVCEAICAFANDLPGTGQAGVLFIGARDHDGSPTGLPITDELLRELSDLRSNGNILPFPEMVVERRELLGTPMAVVRVLPAEAPPIRFRGRTWVRVGPRRAIATREEEQRLSERRRSRDVAFELRACPGATIADLDLDLFRQAYLPSAVAPEVLRDNGRAIEQQLQSLRFLTPTPAGAPTILGILAVGLEPRRHIPGAYVQFLRLDGMDLTDPIKDQAEIDGALPHLLSRIDDKLHAHVAVAASFIGTSTEVTRPDYPVAAIQQIVRNALLHRTYESTNAPVRITWFRDRIEVQSPGGPFGIVGTDNFGAEGLTDYRNPGLAEVMKNLGYVQRFGMGIPIARRLMAENGNPAPDFTVTPTHILAVLRARS
jgi:ATP-dependent DNA helicase RecG